MGSWRYKSLICVDTFCDIELSAIHKIVWPQTSHQGCDVLSRRPGVITPAIDLGVTLIGSS